MTADRTGPPRREVLRELALPLGLVALAAAVRFATLRLQSYEADEAVTVSLVRSHLGSMLAAIPRSESTPPLYYLLAWGWTHVFGTGEVGLRSLSAVFGTLLVGVLYITADRFFTRRAAIVVALLAALSPWLVWYSQEARAYALLALLTTLSLCLFAEQLVRPSGRVLACWALASAAACATHYFAVFPVGVEALWLIAKHGRDGRTVLAVSGVALCVIALAPLALHQNGHGAYAPLLAASGSLAVRVAEIPKQLILGYNGPAEIELGVLGVGLAGAGLVLWWVRSPPADRRRQVPLAAVGSLSIAIPVALAVVGLDLLIARNVIIAWAPLALLVATGIASVLDRRWGRLLAAVICLLSAGVLAADLADPYYQRDDWRDAAGALGSAPVARAIVLTGPSAAPGAPGTPPPVALSLYLPAARRLPARGMLVREIDLVALATHSTLATRRVPRSIAPQPVPGSWHEFAHTFGTTFTAIRYRLDRPMLVRPVPVLGLGHAPAQLLALPAPPS